MMEYTSTYWNIFMPLVKPCLKKRYGKEYTKELVKKADVVYRDLLNRADDIGKDNPRAMNLYSSFIFFALWTAADGRITLEDMKEIVNEMLSFPLLKVMGLANMNKPSTVKTFNKTMHQYAEWLDAHPQYKEFSWDFNFDETKHRDGFYYHFTQCPINTFARREGYLEVLPIMCDIDHKTAALMHAKLHREHTLAGGGEVCDYWYVGDKAANPK